MRTATDRRLYMPYMGAWVVCVLDLVALDELALELVAGAGAAGRPLAGASVVKLQRPEPRSGEDERA